MSASGPSGPLVIFASAKPQTKKKYFCKLNPFMPNGISLSYQLDQPISLFRIVGWYFIIYINFLIEHSISKQYIETLIRHHILWRLIRVSTVRLCPTKRTLDLYGSMSSVHLFFKTI